MAGNSQLLLRLQEELGYFYSDPTLLVRCLTHVSYCRGEGNDHNETLEFLGDAVLDLAISDLLMRRFPEKNEGDLSKMRASLVNAVILAEKAMGLELGKLIQLGKGEERSGGRVKESILSAAFEAVLGGIYWDGGYEAARRVVERLFSSELKQRRLGLELGKLIQIGKGEERSGGRVKESILSAAFEAVLGGVYWEGGYEAARRVVERLFSSELQQRRLGLQDYKTRLQEISQMLFHAPPTYTLVAESGPSHERRFVTEIVIGGDVLGRGEGKSKKQSEQEAARRALEGLKREVGVNPGP